MAQMAGRASVEFYVGLALKGRGERERKVGAAAAGQVVEEAFVIRTFRNGLGVFVSKSASFFFSFFFPFRFTKKVIFFFFFAFCV